MIYGRLETLYWSDDWSPEFYILLAKAGFIPICFTHPDYGQLLIPQIQSGRGFAFWNLGQPEMVSKIHFGAELVRRGEFLKRWPGVNGTPGWGRADCMGERWRPDAYA